MCYGVLVRPLDAGWAPTREPLMDKRTTAIRPPSTTESTPSRSRVMPPELSPIRSRLGLDERAWRAMLVGIEEPRRVPQREPRD
jgi:hypothetical protein